MYNTIEEALEKYKIEVKNYLVSYHLETIKLERNYGKDYFKNPAAFDRLNKFNNYRIKFKAMKEALGLSVRKDLEIWTKARAEAQKEF